MKQEKKLFGFSSISSFGTSRVPCLVAAIKELVPGDSGGSTAFSGGCILGDVTCSSDEMVDRYLKSICMIWLKLGRAFGSSVQQEVITGAKSSGRFSALGRKFCINNAKRRKKKRWRCYKYETYIYKNNARLYSIKTRQNNNKNM